MALIGHQAPGFTDFHPNPFLMSQTFGVVFQHVGLTEYTAAALEAVTQEEVEADMDRVAHQFPFKALDTGFGCEIRDIAASSRHYLAMKKLVRDNNIDALAIRCWPEVSEAHAHSALSTQITPSYPAPPAWASGPTWRWPGSPPRDFPLLARATWTALSGVWLASCWGAAPSTSPTG